MKTQLDIFLRALEELEENKVIFIPHLEYKDTKINAIKTAILKVYRLEIVDGCEIKTLYSEYSANINVADNSKKEDTLYKEVIKDIIKKFKP